MSPLVRPQISIHFNVSDYIANLTPSNRVRKSKSKLDLVNSSDSATLNRFGAKTT